MRIKILFHILAIFLFLFGCVVLHVVVNSEEIFVIFFGIFLPRAFFFDLAIVVIGIAFFIEFFMTFKPIKIINFSLLDKDLNNMNENSNV
ncbi:MAG: hypothetical protein ACFFBP_21525 [Promethearchaeota archaeon]